MTNALIEGGGGSTVQPALETAAIQPDVDTGFATGAAGTDPQWTLDTDLAEISKQVYHGPGDPVGDGDWTRVDPALLEDAGILAAPRNGGEGGDVVLSDPSTGFKSAIYTNGDGEVVVAFAGTDMDLTGLDVDGQDLLNNVQQGVGLDSRQFDQAIALGRKAVEVFGEGNVVFTGHSLGGGLASAAALATDKPAVTFNASGIGPDTLDDLGLSRSDASAKASDGQIRRYNVENDILTNAQQNDLPIGYAAVTAALPDAIGYEITLEGPKRVEDAFRAHGSGTVVEAMKARDIKSEQGDNFVESLLERNLVPMGPSVTDLYQTGEDGVRFVGEKGGELVDFGIDTGEQLFEDGQALYEDGREVVEDTLAAGEDLIEDGTEGLENAAEAGSEFVGDRFDDVGGFVSGLDKPW